MVPAVQLLELKHQMVIARDRQRALQFEDRQMGLALLWINPPSGLFITVYRMTDGPSGLIEIGCSTSNRNSLSVRGTNDSNDKFRQVHVPVVLAAWPPHRQGGVGKNFEPNGRDLS